VYRISHNLSWSIISNPRGFRKRWSCFWQQPRSSQKENKDIYFSVLDIAMELRGRSDTFFCDLSSLLFVFSVAENPVTPPDSSFSVSKAGIRSLKR